MAGQADIDILTLRTVAADFDWETKMADDVEEFAANQRIVSLLVHRGALGAEYSWLDAIRLLRRTLPQIRLIACHTFS